MTPLERAAHRQLALTPRSDGTAGAAAARARSQWPSLRPKAIAGLSIRAESTAAAAKVAAMAAQNCTGPTPTRVMIAPLGKSTLELGFRIVLPIRSYFNELPTSVNTVLTFVPTDWTATMIKTAIKDAIRAYSIAVTPESSLTEFFIDFNIGCSAPKKPKSG